MTSSNNSLNKNIGWLWMRIKGIMQNVLEPISKKKDTFFRDGASSPELKVCDGIGIQMAWINKRLLIFVFYVLKISSQNFRFLYKISKKPTYIRSFYLNELKENTGQMWTQTCTILTKMGKIQRNVIFINRWDLVLLLSWSCGWQPVSTWRDCDNQIQLFDERVQQ